MPQIHSFKVTSAPATPVLTTSEAKLYTRVDGSTEDTLIDALVTAATQQTERELGRALITQTATISLDHFPACGVIELPWGCNAVTGVTYIDQAGAVQTLAVTEYTVDVVSLPGRLALKDGKVWPLTEPGVNAVVVTMTCGFGAAAAVPEAIKHHIRMLVTAMYDNRTPWVVGVSVAELPNRFTDSAIDGYRLLTV